MIMDPDFIVADEPVSMLDASIRTGILRLMLDIRDKRQLSYLFITHDLSLAWAYVRSNLPSCISEKIMELGPADILIRRGRHPYTKALTSIMPIPRSKQRKGKRYSSRRDPESDRRYQGLQNFCSRCPEAQDICSHEPPKLIEIEPEHFCCLPFCAGLR